jgi:glycosyltransferase involved in cell wall biosynthesis
MNALTIIIPVRKEEETIRKTIESLGKNVLTPHLIMIADDSTDPGDTTIEIVKKIKNNSFIISQKARGDADGFGPALTRALKKVTTPYTVIVMADLSDDPKTIDRMMRVAVKTKSDMVCGCRYMRGAKKIGGPRMQGILSTTVNACLFRVVGFPTRDSTNAFKLFRTSFIQSILPPHPSSGVEFSLQLTIQAVRKNARICDVPTVWRGREKGHSKVRLFSRGPKYMKLVFDVLMRRFA